MQRKITQNFLVFILTFFIQCSAKELRGSFLKDNAWQWDKFAGFLAGKKGINYNEFISIVTPSFYNSHQQYMTNSWVNLENNTVGKMTVWQKENIPDNRKENSVFYPLSGADFINVYSLFPSSKRYILVGLEDAGDPSVIESINAENAQKSLTEIRSLMEFYTRYSYFTSKGMHEHMHGHKIYGVLPIFLIAMAKLDMKIMTIKPVFLNENGEVRAYSGDKPQAIYIRFKSPDSKTKELFYFKKTITNESLSGNDPFGKFILEEKNLDLMLKSAVYLFHNIKYSQARDFLLANISFILQDDSGIPYRHLDSAKWTIKLYGNFSTPIQLSGIIPANPVQPDLAKAYTEKSMALPFDYGYGNLRGRDKSNLLTADRK